MAVVRRGEIDDKRRKLKVENMRTYNGTWRRGP
jgi:hypothetical protein